MNAIRIPHRGAGQARGLQNLHAEAAVPADVKAMIGELQKVHAEFMAANDERIAAIESRTQDVVQAEKVDRINAEITKLQEGIDQAMQQIAAADLGGKGADPDAQAKLRQRAAVFHAAVRGADLDRVTEEHVEAYKSYASVFGSYLRRGDKALTPEVHALMQVGSDPDGGYWVPGETSDNVIKRLFETSPMRQVSDVISITADSITWPNDTNDATSGGWVGETESRSDTDTPQAGETQIYVREQYAMPVVTQKLLDMSSVDVEGWLEAKIADKLSRTENTAFVSGTGGKQPRGFLDYKSDAVTTDDASRDWGVLQYTPSGAAGAFPNVSGLAASDPDALITMVSKLKPEYRNGAVFMMSRGTEALLRKLKDANGNYFVGAFTQSATGFDLLGFPIVTAEDMPAVSSDSFSIAFGNFRMGYQIVDGRGIRVLRDNLTTKGKVKFYTTKWTGGDVINFDAIKLMKFASS